MNVISLHLKFLSLLNIQFDYRLKMANLIKAAVFAGRKDPPTKLLEKLVVTGGNQQLEAFLKDAKYGGDDPVALPVFTLDNATPRIKGARWYIQGKMNREVGMFAKDLFPGKNGKIFVEIDDLRIFQFPTNGGEDNNVSAWVDAETLQVRWMEDKENLSREQAEEKGIAKFCLRACLQLESASTAMLWIAAVPLSKEGLVQKRPADYKTRKCPQIHLGIGPKENPGQRSLSIRMAVAEGKREGCGYGVFPALENLSAETPLLPPAGEIREALHLFLRKVGGFNSRSATTFAAAMDMAPENITTREPIGVWPELPENVATTEPEEGRK